MVKEKLRELRKKMQVSQKEMADILCVDVSNYNKREKGICRITTNEWELLAKKLNVEVEDIYEPDEGVYVINGDYAQGNFGNNGTFNQTSEYFLELQQKYILKLEEENKKLKEEIALLKIQIGNG